jgi:short-subunit dehydrogenase
VTTIAIVGAGPQLGLAIARMFGIRGCDVASIARSQSKLDPGSGLDPAPFRQG